MQLTALRQAGRPPALSKEKTTRTMKLVIALSLALLLSLKQSFSQSITLNLQQVPVEKVLKEIQSQTNFRFVYTNEQLKGLAPVTIQVKNATLSTVLQTCFASTDFAWKSEGNIVVLRRRTPEEVLVKGKVVNEAGNSLPGVTVYHQPSGRQTQTAADGSYGFRIEKGGTLLFTSVGFVSQQLQAASDLNVVLSASPGLLDETVVIAYGTTTRRLSTGSISSVKGTELEKQPVTNPFAALQGRLAGVQITQQSGMPGAGFNVLIRGRNSIQNGISPLVIIDGVPFLAPDETPTQRSTYSSNSPFATINPKDIESIEVLKDADATAIYGSRGANGVILITTKRANSKVSRVSLSLYGSTGRQAVQTTFLGVSDYLEMRRNAFSYDSTAITVANAPDLLLWDTTRNIDWRKELTGRPANAFNASLSYEAGSDLVQFALRSNFNREGVMMPGNFGTSGGNLSLNAGYRPANKKLSIEFRTGYAYNNSFLPQRRPGEFFDLPPHAMDIYDSLGGFNWTEGGTVYQNPLAALQQTHRGIMQRISVNQKLRWNMNRNLTFGLTSGMNNVWFDETTLTPIISQRPGPGITGSTNFGNNQIENWSIEPQLEFSKVLARKIKFSAMLGGSLQATNSKSAVLAGTGYTNDILLHSLSGASAVTATNNKSEYRYQALFFRVNAQLREKYLLNVTGRRDGSSRFGPNKRFANFGAVGAGWILNKEKWLRDIKRLSFAKLRGSYGITGNDQISNYQYLDSWLSSGNPYQGVPILRPNKLFNPDYSWEQIRKAEMGLELGFFKDRLFATVNYFRSRSDNQIVNYPLPLQTGFATLLQNFPGVVQNSGWEVTIENVNIDTKDFRWKTAFNITFPRNKLVDFPLLEQSAYAQTLRVGKPLGGRIGYQYTGIDPITGLYMFLDINKDGAIDSKDRLYAGSTDPSCYGGFINTISWKSFEVNFLFEFRKQRGIDPVLNSARATGRMGNIPSVAANNWTPGNPCATYQRFSQSQTGAAAQAASLMAESSGVFVPADLLRLKNIHVGYRLPDPILAKCHISSALVYLEAQNLLTITNYKIGDPETQGLTTTSPLRQIAAGINLQF
ncbi:MAG: SusC/RagA family TonB-linked outer membrane protein [Chitinophagaceae bacterium]|nr:MAG: SusC/RagA family TonB-linked outer membrane protein [Chitinophagaceae bacterium]